MYTLWTLVGNGKYEDISYHTFDSGKPGKNIVVLGGIHGDESHGIAIVDALTHELQTSQIISGKITTIPCVNIQGHKEGVRTLGKDGPDLNRCFGGEGHPLTNDLFELLLAQADVVLDVHDAGSEDVLLPHCRYFPQDNLSTSLAHQLGTSVIIPRAGKPGMLSTHLLEHGISSLTIEAGGGRELDYENIGAIKAGIVDILHAHNLLETDIIQATSSPAIYTSRYGFVPRVEGSPKILSTIGLGDHITKGQLLGTFYDVLGDTYDLISPLEGTVFSLWLDPTILPDQFPVQRMISLVTEEPEKNFEDITYKAMAFQHMPM